MKGRRCSCNRYILPSYPISSPTRPQPYPQLFLLPSLTTHIKITYPQDLDEGNGELPSELNAILESIEAKPIGTELDDCEPWNKEKSEAQNNVRGHL